MYINITIDPEINDAEVESDLPRPVALSVLMSIVADMKKRIEAEDGAEFDTLN